MDRRLSRWGLGDEWGDDAESGGGETGEGHLGDGEALIQEGGWAWVNGNYIYIDFNEWIDTGYDTGKYGWLYDPWTQSQIEEPGPIALANVPDVPRIDFEGRIHDPIPDHVPAEWDQTNIEEALEHVRQSLENRRERGIENGVMDESHGRRYQEERSGKKLEDRLSKIVGAAAVGIGATMVTVGLVGSAGYWPTI